MAQIDYSIIKDVQELVNLDGKVKTVNISRLTAPGENYVSIVLQVDFEVEKNEHSTIVKSVAKRLPMTKQGKRGYGLQGFAMRNEIKWYSEIVPLLKDFANEHHIKMDFYPEYYGARYSLDPCKVHADSDSVLLLENLIPQGYQNDDRYIGSDFITSKAILKNLAVFHALPIVMKIKNPSLFQKLKDFFKETRPGADGPPGTDGSPVTDGPPGPDKQKDSSSPPPSMKALAEILLQALANIPAFAPYLPTVRKLLLEQESMGPGAFNKLTKEPWNTVIHNDFWVNNVMVNYSNETEPLVKILDYQMGSYGSYAKDLVFFLLTSVRNDVIKDDMDDLLRVYYDEFRSVLRQTDDVNLKLTYEDYLEEVRTVAAESEVHHAITFATIIFGEKGTGVDVAVEEFNPFIHIEGMLKKMNQYHKDKLVLIASEATKRNWI